MDDSNENIKKTITATSLCESELSQTNINGLEVNTESDIARDDYVITTFYNWENTEGSLLHRVLSYVPHYTLRHVDSSLINLQRSFSVDGTSVYDFLTGDCAKQFNCIFKFDSTTREVYVYDLYTVCEDCGHRSDSHNFSNGVSDNYICPECGSRNIKYFGTDTTIFVDKENLTEEIQFTTDMDSVKNCLKLVAGDDIMTSTVRLLNANGSDNIVYANGEYVTSGADYAEFFEWLDGNIDNEDRRGYFVTLKNDKIRIANPEDYIIGIISGQPSVIGNGDEDWRGRYILDEFGSYIYEDIEITEDFYNKETCELEKVTKKIKAPKQNPEYDSSKPYVQRKDRPEWDCVGMMGVLSVRDDGTCKVNGYCKVTDGGIATVSDSGYRVIKRVTQNVVKVVFK